MVLPDHREDPRRREGAALGTTGAPGPYQDFARTNGGAQEAEPRAIRDALAAVSVATPVVPMLIAAPLLPAVVKKEVPTFHEWFTGRFWRE